MIDKPLSNYVKLWQIEAEAGLEESIAYSDLRSPPLERLKKLINPGESLKLGFFGVADSVGRGELEATLVDTLGNYYGGNFSSSYVDPDLQSGEYFDLVLVERRSKAGHKYEQILRGRVLEAHECPGELVSMDQLEDILDEII